ncbi:MAG: restriction endonuclease subunit S, partial [Gammaproteobacteria bacterium]|nr:restriction endonuclease subunit S [Gammaproteobacteria bacterium]
MRYVRLGEVADIRAGYPFRTGVQEVPIEKANSRVVQIKDVNEFGEIDWDGVVLTQVTFKREPSWIRLGDVLFSGKGARNIATWISDIPELRIPSKNQNLRQDAVLASPHFFHLQIGLDHGVGPDFIAWQLNQAPAQDYFRGLAEGSRARSVKRGDLEALTVAIPPLETQQAIVKLEAARRRE